MTTKGDVVVYSGTHNVRLPVGTDTYVLTADSTKTDGLAWEVQGSSSITFTGPGGIFGISGSPGNSITESVTGTSGGIPYFSSGSALSTSTALTANGVVYGGGSGTAPSSTSAGTTSQVFIGGTPPSFGNVPTAAIPASTASGTIGGYTPGAQASYTGGSSISSGNLGYQHTSTIGAITDSNGCNASFNIGSVSIPAGVWRVEGFGVFSIGTASSNTYVIYDINTVSNTLRSQYTLMSTASGTIAAQGMTFPLFINSSTSTPVYAIGQYNCSALGTSTEGMYISYTAIN
jgi:hypothetical protein